MRVAVTGASGDIGSAICHDLEARGVTVIRGTHDSCDVTDPQSVTAFMARAWDGRLDGLVNCQGAPGIIKPTLELTDEEFENVIHIDLVGTLRTCRAAARYMAAQGSGSIVNVSSIHALATYPRRAAYAAAKAGVVGLTRALAIEWASMGLRVNAVLPGQVFDTKRTESVLCNEVFRRSPGGILPFPEDVAKAVHFLLTAHGVNGHSLVVDNGWTASAWFGAHDQF